MVSNISFGSNENWYWNLYCTEDKMSTSVNNQTIGKQQLNIINRTILAQFAILQFSHNSM